jgi:hypothetical protein
MKVPMHFSTLKLLQLLKLSRNPLQHLQKSLLSFHSPLIKSVSSQVNTTSNKEGSTRIQVNKIFIFQFDYLPAFFITGATAILLSAVAPDILYFREMGMTN